jgi:mannose-6-phosphate isomerase-like protein (cupin superfamily)
MTGYIDNIEKLSLENENFRQVVYTDDLLQLVLMSLKPGEEIGEEVHHLDQFFRFEGGEGKVVMNGEEHPVSNGVSVVVPSGTLHNIINTSSTEDLKLYTIYTPPNHPAGTIHRTKAEAMAAEKEHGDGETPPAN